MAQPKQRAQDSITSGTLPRSTYLGAAAGLSGAAVGWLATQPLTDLNRAVTSYGALDLLVLAIIGAALGGAILGSAALRKGLPVGLETAAGLAIGALAALAGGVLGLWIGGVVGSSRNGFLVARLVGWAFVGALLGGALGSRFVAMDRTRPLDGLLFGLASGAVGALIFSLPGPTQIWQLLAFLLIGAAVGYATSRIDRAAFVVWRVPSSERPHLLRHREWEVYADRAVLIEPNVTVQAASGRLNLCPAAGAADPVTAGGRPVVGAADISDLTDFRVGNRAYQLRRIG